METTAARIFKMLLCPVCVKMKRLGFAISGRKKSHLGLIIENLYDLYVLVDIVPYLVNYLNIT